MLPPPGTLGKLLPRRLHRGGRKIRRERFSPEHVGCLTPHLGTGSVGDELSL